MDGQLEQLSTLSEDVDAEIHWASEFAEFQQVVQQRSAAARFAHEQAELWRSIVEALPDEGRVLLITHGGIIEVGTIGCLPCVDFSKWGRMCDYCEGVLIFDGEKFVDGKVLQAKIE